MAVGIVVGLAGDSCSRVNTAVVRPATVNVPLFVNEGEMIRINTKSGEYVERVK